MSEGEGKGDRDVAATVNRPESEGEDTVPPTANEDKDAVPVLPAPPAVNEGEEKAATTPSDDEGPGMDPISPIMSYQPGTDHLEPFESDGETKYEGKGKGRTESFSHLPPPGVLSPGIGPSSRPASQAQPDSAPSTAPSTRPVSEAQDDSAPSTAPSTRPVSEAQDDSAPSTAPSTGPVSEAQDDSAPTTAPNTRPVTPDQAGPGLSMTDGTSAVSQEKSDSSAVTAQDDLAPVTDQSGSAASVEPNGTGPSDTSNHVTAKGGSPQVPAQSDSGSTSTLDNPPMQNCFARYDCGCRDVYDDTGKKRQQACDEHRLNPNKSILSLPPKRPLSESMNLHRELRDLPVRTPRVIRDVKQPPRQPSEVVPTKGRHFIQETESGPVFLDSFNSERAIEPTGPPNTLTTIPTQKDVPLKNKSGAGRPNRRVLVKSPDPVTARHPPHPLQGSEGAGLSQESRLDATGGQSSGFRGPMDEQRSGERAATAEGQGGGNGDGDNDDGDHQVFPGRESDYPLKPLNSPHHRRDITPKSILKKAAERDEMGMPPSEQVSTDEDTEDHDPNGGVKLFRATLAKIRAGDGRGADNYVPGPPTPRLELETQIGLVGGEHAASAGSSDSEDDSSEGGRIKCGPSCALS